jgi:predicted metal-dependent phosphoesterase TrpH
MTEREMIKALMERGYAVVPAQQLVDAKKARASIQARLSHATRVMTKLQHIATKNALDVMRLRKLLEILRSAGMLDHARGHVDGERLLREIDEVLDDGGSDRTNGDAARRAGDYP